MKLHRDLGITQTSAWLMMHKVKETFDDETQELFSGQVEADETYIGSKEKIKHKSKKLNTGRGTVGKTAVIGGKERRTSKVLASPITNTEASSINRYIQDNVKNDATLYTDFASAYESVNEKHETVNHSIGAYVKEPAHSNGIESFWELLKRGFHGTFHRMSEKYLARCVNEFAGRHNIRPKDTIERMQWVAQIMYGKQLPYKELVK